MPLESASITDTKPVQAGFLSEVASGLWSAAKQPVVGAEQLFGLSTPSVASESQKQEDSSFGFKFGQTLGGAAEFMGAAALTRLIPGIGRAGSILAGAGLGFLEPVAPGDGIGTRLEQAGIGAGVMSVFEFGPGLVGRTTGIPNTLMGGFGKIAITGAFAGALDVQAESLVNQHQFASLSSTIGGAAGFALGGVAFHGIGLGLRAGGSRAAGTLSANDAGSLDTPAKTAPVDTAGSVGLASGTGLADLARTGSDAVPPAERSLQLASETPAFSPVKLASEPSVVAPVKPASETLARSPVQLAGETPAEAPARSGESKILSFNRSGLIDSGDQGTVYDNGNNTVTKVFFDKSTDLTAIRSMFDMLDSIGIRVPKVLDSGTTADGQPAMVMEKIGDGENARNQFMLGQLSPTEQQQLLEQYYDMADTLQRNGLTVDWQLKNMIFADGKLFLVDPSFIKNQPLSDSLVQLFAPKLYPRS